MKKTKIIKKLKKKIKDLKSGLSITEQDLEDMFLNLEVSITENAAIKAKLLQIATH